MDIPATELRNNLAGRAALFMAILGIGLVGYVVGGWFGPASESLTVDSASPVGAQGVSDGSASLAVLAVGLGLLLVSSGLLMRSRQGLSQAVMRDPLTGLYSRFYAAEALPGLFARDDRVGHSRLVLVRVEIDGLDHVRRRQGASAAAFVLATVGRHIRSQTREDDLPVEPDGEGFAIYLHCEDADQARAFCRRLATLLRSEQLDWEGEVIKIAASMWIAVRQIGESSEDMRQRAAASQGKNVAPHGDGRPIRA
jgi:diguanylate cyclase (GGDEF)-like protein